MLAKPNPFEIRNQGKLFFLALDLPANNSVIRINGQQDKANTNNNDNSTQTFDVTGVVVALTAAGTVSPFPTARVDIVRLRSDVPTPGPEAVTLGWVAVQTVPSGVLVRGVNLSTYGITAGLYELRLRWLAAEGEWAQSRRLLTLI